MIMDCHPKCLNGNDYEWEDTSPFRKPQATSHETTLGKQPHALVVLAANSMRFHIGKLGVADGPLAFEAARAEIMSLQYADEMTRLVRMHCWRFCYQPTCINYGPVVNEWSAWERSEETERELITVEKKKLRAIQKAIEARKQIH